VSTADEFSKKGPSFGEIAAFPGYSKSGDVTTAATSGYSTSFKLIGTSSTSGNDTGSTFEYLVVNASDYYQDPLAEDGSENKNAIDWTTAKWKKLDASKLKITEKLAGQYSLVGGSKKKVTLKAGSTDLSSGASATSGDQYGRTVITEDSLKNAGTLILVRRAGDKASGTRASASIALYVMKEGKKWSLCSSVSNGHVAKKYTLKFAKWEKDAWKADDTLTITVFAALGDDKKQSISSILTNAKLYLASVSDDTWTLGEAFTSGSGVTVNSASGEVTFTGADSKDAETLNIIVRQGANVNVFAKVTASGSGSTTVTGEFPIGKVQNGKVGSKSGDSFDYTDKDITVFVGSGSGAVTLGSSSGISGELTLTSIKVGDEELTGEAMNKYYRFATATYSQGTEVPFGNFTWQGINTTEALKVVLNFEVK
jgi:hypothetical protein